MDKPIAYEAYQKLADKYAETRKMKYIKHYLGKEVLGFWELYNNG